MPNAPRIRRTDGTTSGPMSSHRSHRGCGDVALGSTLTLGQDGICSDFDIHLVVAGIIQGIIQD